MVTCVFCKLRNELYCTKKFLWEILCSSYRILFLYFLCGTRKEARMKTRFPPIVSQIRDTTRVTRKKHVIIGPALE